ncbi:MAG TPA: hypothetical protein VLE02_01960 [Nitrosarchaeum sp.]|nr:hypothetical protein [Nitrosarchaeum sp.]
MFNFVPDGSWNVQDQKKLTTPSGGGFFLDANFSGGADGTGSGIPTRATQLKDTARWNLTAGKSLWFAGTDDKCINFGGRMNGLHAPSMNDCALGSPTSWNASSGRLDFNYQSGLHVANGNLCMNPSKGLYYAGNDCPYGGTSCYKMNSYSPQECRWLDFDTAVKCCSSLSPDSNVCYPSYIPNAVSGGCPEVMMSKCANDWNSDICKNYMNDFINQPDMRKVVQTTLNNYVQKNPAVDYVVPELGGTKRMVNDEFYSNAAPYLCSAAPGACDNILYDFCEVFTRNDCIRDESIQKLCGCFLPSKEYPYAKQGLDQVSCDPICQYNKTVPRAYQSYSGNWEKEKCQKNVCILDNITVNLINSKTGNVDIGQVCGSCGTPGSTGCQCWIRNVNISQINSQSKRIDVSQKCGNDCYTWKDDTRQNEKVNCDSYGAEQSYMSYMTYIIAVIFIVVIVIAIILYWYITKWRK